LSDPKSRALYDDAYDRSGALYYAEKPSFEEIMAEIGKWTGKLWITDLAMTRETGLFR
jgi:hypothetical protein